jgi:hypothetical protein
MTPLDCMTVKDGLPELLAPDPQAPASAAWSAAMQAHLEGCAGCARERDLLVAAWLGLDRLPGLEVRPAWLAGVEAAILAADAAPAPSKSVAHQRPALKAPTSPASILRPVEARGWARWAAAAVLFGLALGGGWWVASPGRRGPGRRPPVVATADPVTEAPVTEAPVTEAPVTEAPDPWTEVVPESATEEPAEQEQDPFFDDLDVVLALSERPREVVTGPPSPDDELVREALELLQADDALSDLDPEEVDDA